MCAGEMVLLLAKRICLVCALFAFPATAGQVSAHTAKVVDTLRVAPDSTRIRLTYQKSDHISLVAGYNYTGIRGLAELGLAFNRNVFTGRHAASLALGVSTEFWKDASGVIIAPKVSCWTAGGVAFGVNFLYYTDRYQASLRFRPELGFGLDMFKLAYGYNLAITNWLFEGVGTHCISLVVLLGLKKLNETTTFEKLGDKGEKQQSGKTSK